MTFVRQTQYRIAPSTGANLSKAGLLTFGARMVEAFSLQPAMYLTVFYESESGRLALRPHPLVEQPEGAAKITPIRDVAGAISIKSIMKRNNIAPGKFNAEWDSDLELIVLSRCEQPA